MFLSYLESSNCTTPMLKYVSQTSSIKLLFGGQPLHTHHALSSLSTSSIIFFLELTLPPPLPHLIPPTNKVDDAIAWYDGSIESVYLPYLESFKFHNTHVESCITNIFNQVVVWWASPSHPSCLVIPLQLLHHFLLELALHPLFHLLPPPSTLFANSSSSISTSSLSSFSLPIPDSMASPSTPPKSSSPCPS